MMKGGKSGAFSGASEGKAVAEEKGKRSQFGTSVGIYFDPKTTKLHSQAEVDEYLAKNGVHLSHRIEVEF